MAKIADMKGNSDSNYTQLFGNRDLGLLMSKIQAAVISAGTELERYIKELIPRERITDLQSIKAGLIGNDVEVICKPKKPKRGRKPGIQSDFAILFHDRQEVYVIELKSGTDFDTQKAPAVRQNLDEILNYICDQIGYGGKYFVCSFHAVDPNSIVQGFKGAFNADEVLVGFQLCEYLGIDFEDVMERIVADQPDNLNYFFSIADKVKSQQRVDPEKYFGDKEREEMAQLRLFWVGDQGG